MAIYPRRNPEAQPEGAGNLLAQFLRVSVLLALMGIGHSALADAPHDGARAVPSHPTHPHNPAPAPRLKENDPTKKKQPERQPQRNKPGKGKGAPDPDDHSLALA